MLRSLDLFSGIGGLSLALLPVCKPLAYCDIHENARVVLRSAMQRRDLPRATILHDVKDMGKYTSSRVKPQYLSGVDVVCGGFPCQDVSVMNIRGKGVFGERSGLVFEAIRIASVSDASVVFLENSPNLVHRGLDSVIQGLQDANFVKIVWGVFSAASVGAPHQRKRLYLMACQNSIKADKTLKKLVTVNTKIHDTLPRWKTNPPPSSRIVRHSPFTRKSIQTRGFLLGNSVVPASARRACEALSKAALEMKDTGAVMVLAHNTETTTPSKWPLVIDVPNSKLTSGEKIYNRDRWATPLSGHWWTSKVGSSRASRHLPNQILYEKKTRAHMRSRGVDDVDEWEINPEFVEWLMGYPAGWTSAANVDI